MWVEIRVGFAPHLTVGERVALRVDGRECLEFAFGLGKPGHSAPANQHQAAPTVFPENRGFRQLHILLPPLRQAMEMTEYGKISKPHFSLTVKNGRYLAELLYSYSFAGVDYFGRLTRDIPTEYEAKEFISRSSR